MTRGRFNMGYQAAEAYDELIAPRFAPIAERLVRTAKLRAADRILELGAGTGVVTRLAAPKVARSGRILATDVSAPMLERARLGAPSAEFALVDYNAPLPFLDGSFDVVLCGLTYVQDTRAALAEVRRVLKPDGRLALSMWGNDYGEIRMSAVARRRMGWGAWKAAAPGRAVRRIEAAGFGDVERTDVDAAPRFDAVDDYIAYRRGFGIPGTLRRPEYERYLRHLRDAANDWAAPDGSLTLGWKFVLTTARASAAP